MGGGAAARSLVGAEVSERDRLPVGSRSPQVAVRRDTRRASRRLLRARTAGIGTHGRGDGSWRRNSRLGRLLVAACFGMLASMIMAAAAVGGAHHFLLGRSVDGRPIVAYEVGDTDSQVRELLSVASTATSVRGSRSHTNSSALHRRASICGWFPC